MRWFEIPEKGAFLKNVQYYAFMETHFVRKLCFQQKFASLLLVLTTI
jgi:hypothetical protein